MAQGFSRRISAVRLNLLWHHRLAYVSRVYRRLLSGSRRRANQETKRGCRSVRAILALRRSGVDVRFPADLFDVSRLSQCAWRVKSTPDGRELFLYRLRN